MPSHSSRNETLKLTVKRHAKVDVKLFFSFPVLLDFFIFVPNILPRIFWANKGLVLTCPGLFQTLLFLHFSDNKSICSIFKKNINQVSIATPPSLMVLCNQYFAYLVYLKNLL